MAEIFNVGGCGQKKSYKALKTLKKIIIET
jgi:hypothetical protein